MTLQRLTPVVVLAVAACVPTGRPTLRPGSDMALPSPPPVAVEKKSGDTCVRVRGVVVNGDAINCSAFAPDSTRRAPAVKPPR